MDTSHLFAGCLAYLDSQAHGTPRPPGVEEIWPRMAVAISRQTGSGAIRISAMLAEYLEKHRAEGEPPWTVFDKNLITRVLEDHHLSGRLAKFLPEDKVNAISDTVDEILGLHPPSWIIVHQSTETILKLAQLGNVILVGRGANAVTSRLPNVLHIRLVGSLERRVARIQEAKQLGRAAALAFIRRTDLGRARYVRRYFHKDVADVLRYDLTINTDHLSEEEVVRLIGNTVLGRVQKRS
jgi:cytidylate kinase